MDIVIEMLALVIAVSALIVAFLSWRASTQTNRATIFDRRYEVYADAERFLNAWMRDGHPDMNELGVLVGAWSRSHFLFKQPVTAYLRELWVDAVNADFQEKVANGNTPGDRDQAIEKCGALLKKHADFDKLRATFLEHLKV